MKEIGGKKVWNDQLEQRVTKKLSEQGYEKNLKESLNYTIMAIYAHMIWKLNMMQQDAWV